MLRLLQIVALIVSANCGCVQVKRSQMHSKGDVKRWICVPTEQISARVPQFISMQNLGENRLQASLKHSSQWKVLMFVLRLYCSCVFVLKRTFRKIYTCKFTVVFGAWNEPKYLLRTWRTSWSRVVDGMHSAIRGTKVLLASSAVRKSFMHLIIDSRLRFFHRVQCNQNPKMQLTCEHVRTCVPMGVCLCEPEGKPYLWMRIWERLWVCVHMFVCVSVRTGRCVYAGVRL